MGQESILLPENRMNESGVSTDHVRKSSLLLLKHGFISSGKYDLHVMNNESLFSHDSRVFVSQSSLQSSICLITLKVKFHKHFLVAVNFFRT